MNDTKTFLTEVPLFQAAPERAIEIAAAATQRRQYSADAIIFQEGDAGEALYMIQKGSIKLSKSDLSGYEKTLAILREPEFFGEMALIGEATRSATALCLEESILYLLFADDFMKLLAEYPQISLNVTTTLARRLRDIDDEAQILSYKDAQGRVAFVLLRLYRGGHFDLNEKKQALIRLTHQELANLAGTSRETVTRALRALEGEQVISTKPKEVLLVDPNGLEEILHGIR